MVRDASIGDLLSIVDVHIKCFPNIFSSHLGVSSKGRILEKYYETFLMASPDLFKVSIDNDNHVVGYVIGYESEKSDIEKSFIKHTFIEVTLYTLFLLLKLDKTAWSKILKIFSRRSVHTEEIHAFQYEKVPVTSSVCLFTICVLPDYRGRNVAVELQESFWKSASMMNRDVCFLSCEKSNIRANAFYNKHNYCCYKIIDDKEIIYAKQL